MTLAPCSGVSGILPPWNVSRKFAMAPSPFAAGRRAGGVFRWRGCHLPERRTANPESTLPSTQISPFPPRDDALNSGEAPKRGRGGGSMAIPRDLAFDVSEFRGRVDAVRARMAARGLDVILVFSAGSINYLSGLADNSLSDTTALVLPLDRDPGLLLFWFEAGRPGDTRF